MHETRRQQAARLRTKGHSINEIADIMGVGEATVAHHIRLAKKRGEATKPDLAMTVIEPLSEDVRAWVVSITPNGATVGETIRAMITDAYHDEVGA